MYARPLRAFFRAVGPGLSALSRLLGSRASSVAGQRLTTSGSSFPRRSGPVSGAAATIPSGEGTPSSVLSRGGLSLPANRAVPLANGFRHPRPEPARPTDELTLIAVRTVRGHPAFAVWPGDMVTVALSHCTSSKVPRLRRAFALRQPDLPRTERLAPAGEGRGHAASRSPMSLLRPVGPVQPPRLATLMPVKVPGRREGHRFSRCVCRRRLHQRRGWLHDGVARR